MLARTALATLLLGLGVDVADVDAHLLRVGREPQIEKMTAVGQELRELVTRLAFASGVTGAGATATGCDAEDGLRCEPSIPKRTCRPCSPPRRSVAHRMSASVCGGPP